MPDTSILIIRSARWSLSAAAPAGREKPIETPLIYGINRREATRPCFALAQTTSAASAQGPQSSSFLLLSE